MYKSREVRGNHLYDDYSQWFQCKNNSFDMNLYCQSPVSGTLITENINVRHQAFSNKKKKIVCTID